MDIDDWVKYASDCKYLPENELNKLCDYVSMLLIEECNIQPVSTPVTICGDIHGQFYDLLELFRTGGKVEDTNYIFMGDFVDRGYYSLETLTLLLALKAKYPEKITLLRGNHESRQITQVYGFYDECLNKYGNAEPWKRCCKLFDLMTIAAIIDDRILCVHGGLSPNIVTLDQILLLDRNQEIPQKGPFCDLVWSDPDDMVQSWRPSPRGAGYLFGEEVTNQFLEINNLSLICRAHQLIQEGIRYQFNNRLVTVWSAPNYCYRCGNMAAVLEFPSSASTVITGGDCNDSGDRPRAEIKQFSAVPDENRVIPPRIITPYFL